VEEKVKLLHFAKLLKEFEKVVPEGESRQLWNLSALWKRGDRTPWHTHPTSVTQIRVFPSTQRCAPCTAGSSTHGSELRYQWLRQNPEAPSSPPRRASWRACRRSI